MRLARPADRIVFPVLQVAVVDEVPPLHNSLAICPYCFGSEWFCNGSAQMGGDYDRSKEAPASCMSHL